MDGLQEDIQKLEILLNTLTENSNREIHRFESIIQSKQRTVTEMRDELKKIKQEYMELQKLGGQAFLNKRNNIISRLAGLELDITAYIKNGALSRVLRDALCAIVKDAREIIESGDDLSKKEEKLEMLKGRYQKTECYLSDSKTEIDKSMAETAIAEVILNIMRQKKREGKPVDIIKEIPKEFAMEIILIIQKQANIANDETGSKKELAEEITKKIQLELLKEREEKGWDISNLAYDTELLDMYFTLSGTERERQEALTRYYTHGIEKTPESTTKGELPNKAKRSGEKRKSATDIYKEVMGIEETNEEEIDDSIKFREYRESKIAELQNKTGRFFSIKPKPNQITVITINGHVKKYSVDKLYKKVKDRKFSQSIEAIITGDAVKCLRTKWLGIFN